MNFHELSINLLVKQRASQPTQSANRSFSLSESQITSCQSAYPASLPSQPTHPVSQPSQLTDQSVRKSANQAVSHSARQSVNNESIDPTIVPDE